MALITTFQQTFPSKMCNKHTSLQNVLPGRSRLPLMMNFLKMNLRFTLWLTTKQENLNFWSKTWQKNIYLLTVSKISKPSTDVDNQGTYCVEECAFQEGLVNGTLLIVRGFILLSLRRVLLIPGEHQKYWLIQFNEVRARGTRPVCSTSMTQENTVKQKECSLSFYTGQWLIMIKIFVSTKLFNRICFIMCWEEDTPYSSYLHTVINFYTWIMFII